MSRALAHARRHRAELLRILGSLTDDTLATLAERGRQVHRSDGFPAGGSVGSSGIARPTEAAALAGYQVDDEGNGRWHTRPDPVGESIAQVFASLAEALGTMRQADRLAGYVLASADAASGRQSTLAGNCGACERPVAGTPADRLVSGYCGACRKRWERAGYPDRMAFERASVKWQREGVA